MNKEKILEDIYRKHTVRTLINRYYTESADNREDLEQDIYLLLMQIPSDLMEELYNNGKLVCWISATIKNQIKSKTSHYYKQYKEFDNLTKELSYDI